MANNERNTSPKSSNDGSIQESEQVFINDRDKNKIATKPDKANPRTLVVKCSDIFQKEFLDSDATSYSSVVTEKSNSDTLIVDETHATDHKYYRRAELSPKFCSDENNGMDLESNISTGFIIYEDENRTDFNEFIDILRQCSNIQRRNSKRTLSTDEELSLKKFGPKLSRNSDAMSEVSSISTEKENELFCQKSVEVSPSEKSTNSNVKDKPTIKLKMNIVNSSASTPQPTIFSLDDFLSVINHMLINITDILFFIKGGIDNLSSNEEPETIKALAFIPPEFRIKSRNISSKLLEEWYKPSNRAIRGVCYLEKPNMEPQRKEEKCQQTAKRSKVVRLPDNALATSTGSDNVKLHLPRDASVKLPLPREASGKISSRTVPGELHSPRGTTKQVRSPSVPPEQVPFPSVPLKLVPSPSVPSKQVPSPSVTPKQVPSPSVTPKQVPSLSVTPKQVPSPSVTPKQVPSPSVTPKQVPSPSVTPKQVSREAASVEVPTASSTLNKPTVNEIHPFLLNQLQLAPSIDDICKSLLVLRLIGEKMKREFNDMKKYFMEIVFDDGGVILEEISFHIWDFVNIIYQLSNIKKITATYLNSQNIDSEGYVLRVKFTIAKLFARLLLKAEKLFMHLKRFANLYSARS